MVEKNQQELMFKLSMFEQQMNQIQQQLQAVEQAIVDISTLNLGLDELVGSKDKEIMAPIGRGIFARAKLLTEELTVDVGGRNFVKKSVPETKEIIQEQIKKLEDVKADLEKTMNDINKEFMKLIEEAQIGQGHSHKHSQNCDCDDEDCTCDDKGNCECGHEH